jgi:hypothetical protein
MTEVVKEMRDMRYMRYMIYDVDADVVAYEVCMYIM